MNTHDKLTEGFLKDSLYEIGIIQDEKNCLKFWCEESEKYIYVCLRGNQVYHLLRFVKDYYYDLGNEHGKIRGQKDKVNQIKNILEI